MKTRRPATRDLEPLTFRASVRPDSVNDERRTAELVWTTGARVLRGGFWSDPWHEELSLDPKHVRMGRLNNGAPLLDSHNLYDGVGSVIGVVEAGTASVDGKRGTATVRFARAEDDPAADAIYRKVKDGIIQNVSVGYRTYKLEKIEGGEGKTPVYRATDWEPHELSVVPVGADDGAGIRGGSRPGTNPCVIIDSQERHMDETESATAAAGTTTDTTAGAQQGATGAGTTESADAIATRAAEQATRAERERAAAIQAIVRRVRLPEEFAGELVTRGLSLDAARAAVLDRLAAADAAVRTEQHVRAEAGEDQIDKWQRGAAAWLFTKAMLVDSIRAAQQVPVTAQLLRDVAFDPGEFRGLTLYDLARHSLEMRGHSVKGLDKQTVVAKAFTLREGSGGLSSTSDFAVLLENVMYKTLLAAYATTPDTWTRFCVVRSTVDFRPANYYRNGTFGTLDTLGEGGEYKNKPIPDGEKWSLTVGTKGNIIGITRQSIINDDMGAFTDLAVRFGRAARLSIEVDVYAMLQLNGGLGPTLADGQPLFSAGRKNINSTGSALSVAGLDADRIVMAQQKDPSGNEILDLRPAVLIVPIGLGGLARVTNTSVYDVDPVAANATNKFMVPNRVVGLFREIVDTPRLSGTRRYLLADPNLAPVFAVGFLDGNQLPYMESQLGWRVDGTEWKLRLDYGVAAIDFRGAVTNAGQ